MSLTLLTRAERRVLDLLAEGLSNKEIARRLSVCDSTIYAHMRALLWKMQAKSRLHAVALYYQAKAA